MTAKEIVETLKEYCNGQSCCENCMFSLQIQNFRPYYICMVDQTEINYENLQEAKIE